MMNHVPFPEAGQGAYLQIDVNALEILEQDYGDKYFAIVSLGLAYPAQAIIARCLALSIKNASDEAMSDAPWGLTLKQLAERLNDALHLIIYGKTVAEFDEERARASRIAARKADAKIVTETKIKA